jgi:uncharacterized lipoprotein YmbA
MNSRHFFSTTLAVLTLAVAGCNIIPEAKPDPSRFFILNDPQATATTSENLGVTLGLLPIELPVYLDNSRSIAVASPGNQIKFRDFDRWAESMDDGITRVLRSALTRAPGIARVRVPPFSTATKRDFDLQVRIIHCEGFESGENRSIRFALGFELTSPQESFVHLDTYAAPLTAWDGSSSELATLLSEAIAKAAQEIATKIPAR